MSAELVELQVLDIAGTCWSLLARRDWSPSELTYALEAETGVPRYQQRLLSECGSHQLVAETSDCKSLGEWLDAFGHARAEDGEVSCCRISLLRIDGLEAAWLEKLTQEPTFPFLAHAPAAVRASRDVALATVQRRGAELRFVSEDLRADGRVVLAAYLQAGDDILPHASDRVWGDYDFVSEIVRHDGRLLQRATEELKACVDVAVAAVVQNFVARTYVAPELWSNRAFVLELLQYDGTFLQYADEKLRNDTELVLVAVQSYPHALGDASEPCRANHVVALEAIRKENSAIDYVSDRLLLDKAFMLDVVKLNGCLLNRTSLELQSDYDIVLAATAENGHALGYSIWALSADPDLALLSVRNSNSVNHVARQLWNDPLFVEDAHQVLQAARMGREAASEEGVPRRPRGIGTMISCVSFLDLQGSILLHHCAMDTTVAADVIEEGFHEHVIRKETFTVKPVFCHDGTSLAYIRVVDMYVLVGTIRNANAMALVVFLQRLKEVLKSTFSDDFDKEVFQDNVVFVRQLLDAMIWMGYPQRSGLESLQLAVDFPAKTRSDTKITATIGGFPLGFHGPELLYRKNELYIDWRERLSGTLCHDGAEHWCRVQGSVKTKAFLSGVPEVLLRFCDKFLANLSDERYCAFDDTKFHRCVRTGRLRSELVLSSYLPDGEVELISYDIFICGRSPLLIDVSVAYDDDGLVLPEILCIKCSMAPHTKPDSLATDIQIKIPLLDAEAKEKGLSYWRCSVGEGRYDKLQKCFTWRIARIAWSGSATLFLKVGPDTLYRLLSTSSLDANVPRIQALARVMSSSVSGMKLQSLKVSERRYSRATTFVRYCTDLVHENISK